MGPPRSCLLISPPPADLPTFAALVLALPPPLPPPAGQFPHVEVNPYEPEVDWFTRDVEVMPLSAAPEPKRRFVPSKWEEKK